MNALYNHINKKSSAFLKKSFKKYIFFRKNFGIKYKMGIKS